LCNYSSLNDLNDISSGELAKNGSNSCDIFLFSNTIVPNTNYLLSYMDKIPGGLINCFCIAPLTNTSYLNVSSSSTNSSILSTIYPIWALNLEQTTNVSSCGCDVTRAAWTQPNQTHQIEVVFDPYERKTTQLTVTAVIQELGLPSNWSTVAGYWGDDYYGNSIELQRVSCRGKRGLLWFLFLFAFLVISIEFGVPMWTKYQRQRGSIIREADDDDGISNNGGYSDL